MKTSRDHIMTQPGRIAEAGITVADVTGLPVYGEMYISPNYRIVLCHQGHLDMEYDSQHVTFNSHNLAIIYPHHAIFGHSASPDYQATVVIVSAETFKTICNHIALNERFADNQSSKLQLSESQSNVILAQMRAMQAIDRMDTPHRIKMLQASLLSLLEMVNVFRDNENGVKLNKNNKRLSNRFNEAVSDNFPPHRDVAFYANMFCLSPKYFSFRIQEETGHSASYWLQQYVVAKAKMLMRNHADATLKQIADMLGFPEQSSFSRYFKRETGMSPDTWRRQ